jgi:hypothetical protein
MNGQSPQTRSSRPSETSKSERKSLMLRPSSEGHRDPLSTEYEEDRPTHKARRRVIKSAVSRNRRNKAPIDSRRLESMCWVDVFPQEYFGGRLTRLHEGDHKDMKKLGSIIVGPEATARCVDRKTNKAHYFRSRAVSPSISFRRNHFPIRIEVVSAIVK